jgi:predicted NAD-dependent protein-ADP-ribosyltransferase YbiA (DUF1768 family)
MNSSINILNPTDKPFGRLSNNYKMLMELDDKKWNSVSNYIYANSMPVPLYSNLLHNIEPKEASREFNNFINKMIETTAFTALQNALFERLNRDEKFRDTLFATGNAPIVYDSDDKLLGAKNRGVNLVGKVMEQLRNQNIVKHGEEKMLQSEQELIVKIHRNYIAYMILMGLIRDGKSSLVEFLGAEPTAIIKELNPNQLQEPNPPIEIIFNMYKKRQIPEAVMSSIVNFDVVIHQLRKEHLRNVTDARKEIIKNIIFDTYLREMLRREYENFSEQQIEEALSTIHLTAIPKGLNERKDQINKLFEQNMFVEVFSEHMTNIINERVKEYTFILPREAELKEVESYVMPSFSYQPFQEMMSVIVDDKKEPIVIIPSRDEPLCVENENSAVIMDGRVYPSVAHYVFAMLLSQLFTVKNIGNAHKLLVVDENKSERDLSNYVSSQRAKEIFFENLQTSVIADIKKYAKIALDKKFQDKFAQDILLTSGNTKLIWSDPNDRILGMVKENGENFAGEYMMELRNKLKQFENDLEKKVEWSNVIEIMETDKFISKWVELRIEELMMNAHIIAMCCRTTITPDLLKIIIEELYDKCSLVSSQLDVMPDIVPKYFKNIVKSFVVQKKIEKDGEEKRTHTKIMANAKDDVMTVIWQYALVLVFTMYQSAKEHSVQSMRELIAESEIYLSKKKNCKGEIPNNVNKCIFSALVNVLSKIKKISQSVLFPFKINQKSINIAINIILNKNVQRSEELSPDEDEEKIEANDEQELSKSQNVRSENPFHKLAFRRRMKVKPLEPLEIPSPGGDSDDEEDELVFEASDDESGSEKSDEEGIFEPDDEDKDDEDMGNEDEDDELIQGRMDENADLSSTVIDYHIINELKVIDLNIDNEEEIITLIKNAIKEIVHYRMPFKIKINRINFFATLV